MAKADKFFAALLARFERSIANAFRAAVADLRRQADLQAVITALAKGDIDAAINALNVEPAAYNAFVDQIQAAYSAGGEGAVSTLAPIKDQAGSPVVIRFNARNYRAEAWLRDHSSKEITRIVEDQRQAVRAALVRAMEKGANPRTAGLDIVGRINRATGQREGGILGLSAPQEKAVEAAKLELASSDPAGLKNYLTRARRDRRFDRTINKAIREETAIPAETARKALNQYRNKLLDLRGETIGLSEGLASLQAAKQEAYIQAVESGKISARAVSKTWNDCGLINVRMTHRMLNGNTVGLYEPFKSVSGARMMFPGDRSLGAPASETTRCRCNVTYTIDFLADLE